MHIATIDKSSSLLMYHKGFAEVFRAEHRGRLVAVKSIVIYTTSNFEAVASVNASLFWFWSNVCL